MKAVRQSNKTVSIKSRCVDAFQAHKRTLKSSKDLTAFWRGRHKNILFVGTTLYNKKAIIIIIKLNTAPLANAGKCKTNDLYSSLLLYYDELHQKEMGTGKNTLQGQASILLTDLGLIIIWIKNYTKRSKKTMPKFERLTNVSTGV